MIKPLQKSVKGFLCLVALLMLNIAARAQGANTYSFAESSGTYTPITGTSSSASGDDGIENNLPIGFNFTYGGTVYTTFSVTTNGFIKLGGTISTGTPNYSNAITAASNAPLIAAFWDDNNLSGGNIQYLTAGSAGSQTLTVQWTNDHIGGSGSSSNPTMSFQIILYETTNQIQIIYGGASATLSSATGSIGITTASGNYLSVTPGAPATASTTSGNNSISSASDLSAGTIYTFLPPPPCNGTPAVGQTTATVTNACSGTAFTLGVTGLPVQTGYSYEFQSSPAGANTFTSLGAAQTSPTFSVASQTAATDYQVIVTCTNTSQSTTATLVSVGQSPFYNCYCTPGSSCTNEGIENVTFGTLNNTSTFCNSTSGYTDYASLGSSASVGQAQVVPISITAHINSNPASAGVWIDYNHSGTFDASEYTALANAVGVTPLPATYTFTGNVTIDPNAQTGITRMRVRSANQSGITATSACTSSGVYGEYEDYLITINAGATCSGNPAGGTASGPATICAGASFNLTATGYTTGVLGLSYQWESSPAGAGTWTTISGATTTSYTVASGITQATDFRLRLTCSNGNGTDVSTTATVPLTPFYNCYCTPASNCTNEGIENVTFATLNKNSTFCTNTSGYTDSTSLGSLATVAQAQVVTMSVTGHINSSPASAGVWIDFNHSGTFDASEYTSLGTVSGVTPLPATYVFTGNVVIDQNALTGITRMRVRTANQGGITAASACTNSGVYGEYEDYLITISAGTACSGTPTAGTITAPASMCPNIPFTMTPTGFTSGVTGISYLWEMYDPSTSAWGPAPGTNNTLTYSSAGITAPTDFRFTITCANGNGTNTSPSVTVGLTPFMTCYCTPSGSSGSYGINNFSTTGAVVDLSNLNSGYSTGGYGNFTSQTLTVTQSDTVTFSANYLGSGSTYGFAIFIDYDHNGLFSDPGETVFNTTAYATSASGSIAIPATALLGSTRMRIVANYFNNTPTGQYCNTGISGEFEDYTLNVITLTSCNGVPLPGTAYGPAGVCSGNSFTLVDTASTIGTGISYQWESSPAGVGLWQPINGATNVSYTEASGITSATDYRLSVTCSNGGGNDVSNIVGVSINPVSQCYCIPTYSSGGANDYITNVQLGTLVNNTTAAGNVAPFYTDYTSQQPATLAIPDLAQSVTYNLSVSFGSDGSQYSRVWIDFDQDGAFSQAESFSTTTNAGASGTANISIQVPSTAILGNTRMRIRGGDDSQPTDLQACGASASNYGEAEDYLVNITAPPTCIPPSSTSVSGITTGSADLNWTASSTNPSGGYDYYYNTSSTAPTATTLPNGSVGQGVLTVNISGLNSSSTYYYWVRSNCGGNDYSSWIGGSFMTLLANDLPAGATPITVNAGCSTFSNVGGSFTTGEPTVSCVGGTLTQGALVWFSFVAPTSGFVRVTTDGSATTLDTKLGVFTTSNPGNPADLTAYSIIACDDDNGITTGTASTVFVSGLTSGTTYYIGVDRYNGAGTGNFCVAVDEVTTSMLSPSGSCAATGQNPYPREDYAGWATIVDDQGRLIANVRRVTAGATNTTYGFSASLNVNTGGVRANGTRYYLDRNFLLGYTQSNPATTFDVSLYFLDAELTALQAVDNTATLNNLNVTHQTGTTCVANFNSASGTNSLLTQMNNGTANGIDWITVNTPGFSNFYIMAGTSPLLINLKSITASNFGSKNRIDWTTASEMKGDYFELERSADGRNFTRIASLNAKGEASSYTYWDESPLSGTNHYRLKMYASSGNYSYSDIVTANVKGQAGFSVEAYPNPVTDVVNIRVSGSLNANASISITDISGKTVLNVPVTNNLVQVNMSGLANGIYMIKYADDAHSKTIKLTKE